MKLTHLSIWTLILTLAVQVFTAQTVPSALGEEDGERKKLKYQIIPQDAYQNFLVNWETSEQKVLCGVISSSEQYDTLFHAAAIMGGKKPYAPPQETYDKEQIVVIGRILDSPPPGAKVFQVDEVTENDGELIIKYRFKDPMSKASFSAKSWLALKIPKSDLKSATFIENGEVVGELDLQDGKFSLPEIAKE